MSLTSAATLVEDTVKLLVLLFSESKATPEVIAKSLKRSVSWVNDRVEWINKAGLPVKYDTFKHQYFVTLTDEMTKGSLWKLATRFDREMRSKGLKDSPVKFTDIRGVYTKKEMAERLGVSQSDLQNRLDKRYGLGLPRGIVGYRLSEGGRWLFQYMPTDRTGKLYEIPDDVKRNASEVSIGDEDDLNVEAPKPRELPQCIAFTHENKTVKGKKAAVAVRCPEMQVAKGLCHPHYDKAKAQAQKYPDVFRQWLRDARTAGVPSPDVAKLHRWLQDLWRQQT